MKFKAFYNELKCEEIFNKVFTKYYNRGHWGNITRKKIYEQQKDWFYKLRNIINEANYDDLLSVVGNRDNQVTREYFGKLTRITIKKKRLQYVKEKLMEFCIHSRTSPVRIGIVGFSDEKAFDIKKATLRVNEFYDKISKLFPKNEIVIVSGLTNMGIPKIAYTLAQNRKWKTVGISAEEALKMKLYPVDSKIIVGKKFGDESMEFINNIDILGRFGGGLQSEKEEKMIKEKGIKVYSYEI
jgi:hypothetical protein